MCEEQPLTKFPEDFTETTTDNGTHQFTEASKPGTRELHKPALMYYAIFLSVIGSLGNIMTVTALCNSSSLRRQTTTWFTLSLSISDFLFSVIALPFTAFRHAGLTWVKDSSWCQLGPFIYYGSVTCSIITITTITINRYIRIVHFHLYHRVFTYRKTTLVIIGIWILSYGFMIPALLGIWGKFAYIASYKSCYLRADKSGRSPRTMMILLQIIVPVITTIMCYIAILYHVVKARKALRRCQSR
ncbi:unnamed protein product [Allacma fusca]|uniref:G-protein coupled receptors family 1 profile domain-containing protein n=1 Tax=Allacma fusca TaxID=39272 RepID=A0A8J2J4L7_9HEXA|nr:unnamed protein product [Allacma fusca]